MNQEIKNKIFSKFIEDWGESTPQFRVCVKIFDYISSRDFKQLRHLTYGNLKRVIGNEYSVLDLLKATQYLCGDRTEILLANFEFYDDKDDNYLPIDFDDVKIAKRTGRLVHPRTGEYITNFEDKVFIYFTPNPIVFDSKIN